MAYKRNYADRREYLIEAVAKRRKRLRRMALEYLGGKCCCCGYNRCEAALDFHHVEESSKQFGLSQSGMTRSWKRTKQELDKCIFSLCKLSQRDTLRNIAAFNSNVERKNLVLGTR